jgi:hypothetical protein
MWKWIKKLFTPKRQEPLLLDKEVTIDYSKLTKGDLKKLLAQGKIKSIYNIK